MASSLLARYGLSAADVEAAPGGAGLMTAASEWDLWTEIGPDNDL